MDAEALQGVLRSAGVLPVGRVNRVESADTGAFNAEVVRLRVEYSVDTASSAPHALVVKRPAAAAWSRRAAVAEAKFYELATRLDGHPPVLAPLVAANAGADPFVLLVDLSATHESPLLRENGLAGGDAAVPACERIAEVVRTLARLHAYWWGHPALAAIEPPYWSAAGEGFTNYAARRERSWRQVIAQSAAHLPDGAAELYERVFAGLDTAVVVGAAGGWAYVDVGARRRIFL